MTMQSNSICGQPKQGADGKEGHCQRKRLYRVSEEDGAAGTYWTITLGTPANPPTLCKQCATLDAMARNRTAQIQRGMQRARTDAEAKQSIAEPAPPADPEVSPDA